MNKLKFHLINYKDILSSLNIVGGNLDEYLNGGRQDVLENFDIFCENVRSKNKKLKNFDLFERVNVVTDDCVIVLGLYLELLEFWGQRHRIYDVVKFYTEKYPNNKIVVQWNHDSDAADVFSFINDFNNLYVLNFNTSINHNRFIVLPFWAIDDELVIEEKTYLGNLVCSLNNGIRSTLKNLLLKNSNFYVSERISFEQYKRILSSSKFTFCPKGNGLSSYRFFESFHLNSIPVLIADNVILPYVDKINYTDFIVRIKESDCNNLDYIINRLNGIEYDIMLQKLNEVREMFTLKGVQEEVYNRLSL
jgi:hypothetical protein